MKLMHLSDLHLGKRLIDYSLIEDQQYILDQIIDIAERERPDAVLIAGDVYDRAVPPVEAVRLFDGFMDEITRRGIALLIISGNHDSEDRLAYAGRQLRKSGVYISPVYDGKIDRVTLSDAFGDVNFYLMPYVHPENVRRYFEDREIANANDAAAAILGSLGADFGGRNVILSHQFIGGGETSDSERRSVGTLEDVDAALYAGFDYVALGHLHKPQNIGRADGTMRYSGTPIRYSRSELYTDKSVTMVELGAKGDVRVRELPLAPLRGMRELKGSFDELMAAGPAPGAEEDFYFIVLTDAEDIPNAAVRLRETFGHVLELSYDNARTRSEVTADMPENIEEKSPEELLRELFSKQNGVEMSDEALAFVREQMKKIEEWNI